MNMILRYHLLDPDVSTSHYTRVGNNNRIEDHQVCQDSWDETSMKDLREVSRCNHQHNHLLVPNIPLIKINFEIVSTRILESSSCWWCVPGTPLDCCGGECDRSCISSLAETHQKTWQHSPDQASFNLPEILNQNNVVNQSPVSTILQMIGIIWWTDVKK